jgi:hypothetical protein
VPIVMDLMAGKLQAKGRSREDVIAQAIANVNAKDSHASH